MKIAPPVLLKNCTYEFEFPTQKCNTPEELGKVLMKANEGEGNFPEKQTKHTSGVGKLLHVMWWS